MNNDNKGFTLLELMVGIAILGIIAAIALPNYGEMLESERTGNFMDEFNRSLKFARATATASDAFVIVCPLSSTSCTSDWKNDPITIFVDSGATGAYDSSADTILRVVSQPHKNDTINHAIGTTNITFDSQGRLSEEHQFIICGNGKSENTAALRISQSGNAWNLGINSGLPCS